MDSPPPSSRPKKIRPRTVWTIYAKEIRETFRDRKTLFLIVGIPLIFYPLMLLVATEITLSQVDKLQKEVVQIALEGEPLPEELQTLLTEDKTLEVVSDTTVDALEQATIHAVLHLEPGFTKALSGGETADIAIRYSSVRPLSKQAYDRLKEHLQTYSDSALQTRLTARGLDQVYIEPIKLNPSDIAPEERQVGSLLAQFLPMIILIFMVTGAFYPAIDLTAGEKERKTIQTLLTSPVRPLEIVTGKYLVVFSMAMGAGLVNLLSIGLVTLQGVSMGAADALDIHLEFSALDIAALVVVVVLFGLMLSAVLMTIASLASSPKDAQTYMTPVYLMSLLPMMIAGLPGVELSETTAFIPVLNLALIMKEILIEGVNGQHLFIVALSTMLITTLTLLITARIYNRQDLLIQPSTVQGLFSLARSGGGKRSTPGIDEALVLIGVLFLLLYYVGSLIQSQHLLLGLVLTLYGLLLVPTLLFIKLAKLDWKATLHLRHPPALAMAGATLIGISAFVWLSALTSLFHETFLPIPEPFLKAMEDAFSMPTTVSGKMLYVVVMALSPALCEEAVFRGVLLSSFRKRTGTWVAVFASALLFGMFHLSIYRLLPTMMLGMMMGYVVWRSGSIWPAVMLHFLSNTCSLLSQDIWKQFGIKDHSDMPLVVIIVSGAITVAGLALIRLAPAWEPPES